MAKLTQLYKLDTYQWDEDDFMNVEKEICCDFSHLSEVKDIRAYYDAVSMFLMVGHRPKDI